MKKLICTSFFVLLQLCFLQAQTINTFAGNGTPAYTGDGGPATAAELQSPDGVALDAAKNAYIADYANSCIRKVDNSGIISTFAGNGTGGYSGDGGPATAAEINNPTNSIFDASGNLYIADYENARIRKVNTSGIITTIAGNGITSYSGDGGPATAAEVSYPSGLAIDKTGNIYIAEFGDSRIRKINTSGIISTYAGNGTPGYGGDGGSATAAELNTPTQVAIDGSGNLYIADFQNFRVRLVNTSGVISTVAGNGTPSYSGDGGPATAAEIFGPCGVDADASGNIYIAEYIGNHIRFVNTSGIISTIAGNGVSGYSGDGGPAVAAELSSPSGVTFNSGNIYISDQANDRIRIMTILTGVNEVVADNGMKVYPNPSNGIFTIQIKNSELSPDSYRGKSCVDVYDMLGEKVYSTGSVVLNSGYLLNLKGVSNGIYLLKVTSEDGSETASRIEIAR